MIFNILQVSLKFNLSFTTNSIPNIWKLAKIIPILKPNKSPPEPASYRPISLLYNPSKILERLVLNNITTLTYHPRNTASQHSTSTLLTNLTQTLLEGLNPQKPAYRSLLAAIDISKAFDTVSSSWYLLINKILNTHTHPNFKKNGQYQNIWMSEPGFPGRSTRGPGSAPLRRPPGLSNNNNKNNKPQAGQPPCQWRNFPIASHLRCYLCCWVIIIFITNPNTFVLLECM